MNFALTLFITAAITDWFDGYLARLWKQESKFGTMLDPIADKAMVVIALLIITGYSGMNPWLILPATVILFREIFVGGLREFLGAKARLCRDDYRDIEGYQLYGTSEATALRLLRSETARRSAGRIKPGWP